MVEPAVIAVMLTHDRHEMAARAIHCFQGQTYTRKLLLIYNNGSPLRDFGWSRRAPVSYVEGAHASIGEMRNEAIRRHAPDADIIVTWDDDDLSHPCRIAEQVALMQSSGADIVGYHDLLFRRGAETWIYCGHPGYAPGTTLAFWRRTWEARPFPDISTQEDYEFQLCRKVATESSLKGDEPRMIATIHGANTGQARYDKLLGEASEFRRTPEWDRYSIPRNLWDESTV